MPLPDASSSLLVRAARGAPTERTPVWLMRQAGRFDPEYQKIRSECGLELEDLFREPNLAAEITMLPARLGVDALILFQDILTPLSPMGATFVFRPGPVLEQPIHEASDFDRLHPFDPAEAMPFVPESIRLVRQLKPADLPLLGFAGSPLTLAVFILENGSPRGSVENTRLAMTTSPEKVKRLLDLITDMTADYLLMQIEAGVDGIQLFESVGDLFSRAEYKMFALPYQQRIMERLGERVPRILFVKDPPAIDLLANSGADVLSVGGCIDIAEAKAQYGDRFAFQGNADNLILRDGSFEEIDREVRRCIAAGAHTGHILNLNHGILPGTPFDNVARFIETARSTTLTEVTP